MLHLNGAALRLAASLSAIAIAAPLWAQQAPAQGGELEQGAEPAPVEDIVVTGSRIVREGFAMPTPVTVVSQDQMQKLGVNNVSDALNRIPAFRATNTPATVGTSFINVGARLADLRGLGATRTLVLVNGRRFVPSNTDGTVNLNLIPSSMVQRMEVVTGGASAAYGSDAVSGVVNLILDSSQDGMKASASYGQAWAGDAREVDFSLSYGKSFADGRGHILLGGEYNNNDGTGDCYSRDWCARSVLSVPNPLRLVNGQPANIIASSVHTSSTTLQGMFTAGVLKGTAFNDDGSTRQFQYGTIVGAIHMIGGEGGGFNNFIAGPLLVVPVERVSTFGQLGYDLTDSVKLSAELSWGKTIGQNLGAPGRDPGSIVIRADNAYLPADLKAKLVAAGQATAAFGRSSFDLGFPLNRSEVETWRGVLALDGKLGGGWSWNLYYQYGRSDYDQTSRNNRITANFNRAVDAVVNPANGQITCRALLSADPAVRAAAAGCQPMNLFGQYNWTEASKAYVFADAWQSTRNEQHVVSASVQGDVVQLPAGALTIAAGAEYREEKAKGAADPISLAGGFYYGNGVGVTGNVRVKEGFAEAVLPVLADMPFARKLELNGAIRRTNYSTSGSVTTWKVGGVYEPAEMLRLRITRSRDIRAPNISELYSSDQLTYTAIVDKQTNTQVNVPTLSGGNPDLTPEHANTFTAGVILAPTDGFARGFRFSADYYKIKIEEAISRLGTQTIADRCYGGAAEFCDLITRNSAGAITSIRNPFLNLNAIETEGVDFEASYAVPLRGGADQLGFRLLATYVAHLTTTDSRGAIDRAGMTGLPQSGESGVPHWQLNGSVTWDRGPFSATVEGRYIPEGIYDVTLVGPQDAGYDPALANSINDNRVPSRFYTNLNLQYDLWNHGGEKGQIFLTVNNLFDVDAPNAPPRTNAYLFDVLGRAFRVGFRFTH